jgi:hypothetical protein
VFEGGDAVWLAERCTSAIDGLRDALDTAAEDDGFELAPAGSSFESRLAGAAAQPARVVALFSSYAELPRESRNLAARLGDGDHARRRLLAAANLGVGDELLLRTRRGTDLCGHRDWQEQRYYDAQGHGEGARSECKWRVVLRPLDGDACVTSSSAVSDRATFDDVLRAHRRTTLFRRFASLAEAEAYSRGAGYQSLPTRR